MLSKSEPTKIPGNVVAPAINMAPIAMPAGKKMGVA